MKVITLNATYDIDMQSMKVTRLPQDGAGQLRRDAEELTLYSVPNPVIGERMALWIQVREDGIPTLRDTSPVTEVQP